GLACGAGIGAGELGAQAVDPERLTQVRAAFVLNFVRYTEWPASAFAAADSPYFVVVFDDDGVAQALEELAERAGSTGGRALRVIKLRSPKRDEERAALAETLRRSHVVYLGEKPDRELVAALAATSVLTIAADAGFVHEGGMIALVVEDNRVTFDVDADAIRGRGLVLSSRVLRLARSVSHRP
ncbi:MAG: YfiR family protein, partial [Myxococcota bacterium]